MSEMRRASSKPAAPRRPVAVPAAAAPAVPPAGGDRAGLDADAIALVSQIVDHGFATGSLATTAGTTGTAGARPQAAFRSRDLRQSHVVYQGFNEKLLGLIGALRGKLPDFAVFFDVFEKQIARHAQKDVAKPMRRWREATAAHAECMRAYTQENVEHFVKHATGLPMLGELRIADNWSRFTEADRENLWRHLSSLQSMVDMCSLVDDRLMDAVQTTAMRIRDRIQRQPHQQEPSNAEIQRIMFTELQREPAVAEGIQRMLAGGPPVADQGAQLPEALQSMMQRFGVREDADDF